MKSTALVTILFWVGACSSETNITGPSQDSAQVLEDAGSSPTRPLPEDAHVPQDITPPQYNDTPDVLEATTEDVPHDENSPVLDIGSPDVQDGISPVMDVSVPDGDDTEDTYNPYISPYSQASDLCPDMPLRGNIRTHEPEFDKWGPEMPAYWAPESVWETEDGKVRVRAAWVHGAYCWDSRSDLLPAGWMTIEVDPTAPSLSVVGFSADKPDMGTTGKLDPNVYTDGMAIPWFYLSGKNPSPYCTAPTTPPLFEMKVGDAIVHVHGGCIELMEPDAHVIQGITITKDDGTTTALDIPLSVCLTTAEEVAASGCVGGDDDQPEHPEVIPDEITFIYFELGPDTVYIIDPYEDENVMVANCCSAWPNMKIEGVLTPNIAIHVRGLMLGGMRQKWQSFRLELPVKPVGQASHWSAQTLNAKGVWDYYGFYYHDGFQSAGKTMASHDFYTTNPVYTVNSSLTKYDNPWISLTLTQSDETWTEGTFEGEVAPALSWEEWPRTQVGPSVPLKNGKFRLKTLKFKPIP